MTFFQNLFDLALTRSIGFTASANKELGQLTLIVRPLPEKDGKTHPAMLEQFLITGTPAELDEQFVAAITSYKADLVTISATLEQQAMRMEKAITLAAKPPAKTAASKPASAKARPTMPTAKAADSANAAAPEDDDAHDDDDAQDADTFVGPMPQRKPTVNAKQLQNELF